MNFLRYTISTFFLLVLGACSDPSLISSQGSSTDQTQTDSASLAVPRQLLEARAVDVNLLTVSVTIDGNDIPMTHNQNRTEWSGDIRVPPNTEAQLQIEWFHDGLPVAGYNQAVGPYSSNQNLTINSSEYVTTGTRFDSDRDGLSNLEELRNNFDPNDDSSPGSADIDVIIPWIAPADAPKIDGLYDQVWTNGAVFSDRRGNNLSIDNLMIDIAADRPDGATEFKWAAMHDGTYLYIMVFAESVSRNTLQADSVRMWRDDTLNLFIDGDNSKGSTYDGLNDYHVFIPFLKLLEADTTSPYERVINSDQDLVLNADGSMQIFVNGSTIAQSSPVKDLEANTSQAANGRVRAGDNSVALPAGGLSFANCKCDTDQHTYELRIKFSDFGITRASAFGLELQLDDDISGGGRDARYGWRHPSRTSNVDVDQTWQDPSFMGTAILR